MKTPVELKLLDSRIGSEFPLPNYATPGSAGMDLRAMIDTTMVIEPGKTVLIPTGLQYTLPIQVLRQ